MTRPKTPFAAHLLPSHNQVSLSVIGSLRIFNIISAGKFTPVLLVSGNRICYILSGGKTGGASMGVMLVGCVRLWNPSATAMCAGHALRTAKILVQNFQTHVLPSKFWNASHDELWLLRNRSSSPSAGTGHRLREMAVGFPFKLFLVAPTGRFH